MHIATTNKDLEMWGYRTPPLMWPSWFTGSLMLLGMAILIVKYATPNISIDVWWHMVLGRQMLATGALITDHSLFTWTPATPYHVYNNWISQILLYVIYDLLGSSGFVALRYLVLGGFFALAAHYAKLRGVGTHPLTWIVIIVGIMFTFVASNVQPELFSIMFMVVTVWLFFLIRSIGAKVWWWCYFFPLIVVLWSNSHGAFLMSAPFFSLPDLVNYLMPTSLLARPWL